METDTLLSIVQKCETGPQVSFGRNDMDHRNLNDNKVKANTQYDPRNSLSITV